MKRNYEVKILPFNSQEVSNICRCEGPLFTSWLQYWERINMSERNPLTHPVLVASHIHNTMYNKRVIIVHSGNEVLTVLPVSANNTKRGTLKHANGFMCRSLSVSRDDSLGVLKALFNSQPYDTNILSIKLEADEGNHLLDIGWPSLCIEKSYRSLIMLQDGFEEMLSRFSSSRRYSVRRLKNKMHRDHVSKLLTLTNPDDVKKGYYRFLNVDSKSWKKHSGMLLSKEGARKESLRMSLNYMAQLNKTVIQILQVDGIDIAAQLCFNIDNQLIVYKTSYDIKWSKYGPGKLLLAESMRTWCEKNNITVVNMVTGHLWDMWNPRQIAVKHLWIFKPGIHGKIEQLLNVPLDVQGKILVQNTILEKPIRCFYKRLNYFRNKF